MGEHRDEDVVGTVLSGLLGLRLPVGAGLGVAGGLLLRDLVMGLLRLSVGLLRRCLLRGLLRVAGLTAGRLGVTGLTVLLSVGLLWRLATGRLPPSGLTAGGLPIGLLGLSLRCLLRGLLRGLLRRRLVRGLLRVPLLATGRLGVAGLTVSLLLVLLAVGRLAVLLLFGRRRLRRLLLGVGRRARRLVPLRVVRGRRVRRGLAHALPKLRC
ncbi:hypothetical protein GCM10027590_18880 [Nocardiopsis nanhaiensis]